MKKRHFMASLISLFAVLSLTACAGNEANSRIIPFNVHNGSRFSGTIATIKELEPDAEVIEDGFTVSESNVAGAEGDVMDWLNGLGY